MNGLLSEANVHDEVFELEDICKTTATIREVPAQALGSALFTFAATMARRLSSRLFRNSSRLRIVVRFEIHAGGFPRDKAHAIGYSHRHEPPRRLSLLV